jgi:hypothetical protein
MFLGSNLAPVSDEKQPFAKTGSGQKGKKSYY